MRLLRYLIRIFGPNSQTIEKHLAENKTFRKAVLQSKNIIEDVMQDFVDLKQGKGKSGDDLKDQDRNKLNIKYLPNNKEDGPKRN